MNQGKLTLREIGSRSMNVEFTQEDAWVKTALEMSAPHVDIAGMSPAEWAAQSKLKGQLAAERIDPDYSLYGHFEVRVPVLCPRCNTPGTAPRASEFRLFIHPVGAREEVEEGDDPDYIFLETPYIDLSKILSEQVVAVEPVVEFPDQEISGKAHECQAQDLDISDESNLQAGQSEGKARNSPFAVLGKLKDLKTRKE